MGQRRKDRELFWRGVLQRQAQSGLSVAGFCRQESISAPSFYAWRRKLREPDATASQVHDDHAPTVSAGQLLPVRIESSASSLPVRILLPQGVSIETSGGMDGELLADLLRVLREAAGC